MKARIKRNQNLLAILAVLVLCGIGLRFSRGSRELTPSNQVKVEDTYLEVAPEPLKSRVETSNPLLESRDVVVMVKEGDITLKLRELPKVVNASVKLSLPKVSHLYKGSHPTARLLLTLKDGQELETEELQGIHEILLSEVPSLEWRDVLIIDSNGRELSPQYRL